MEKVLKANTEGGDGIEAGSMLEMQDTLNTSPQ